MNVSPEDRRRDLLEQLRARTHFFDRPPQGFDPLKASDNALARYGIPPRPNVQTLPRLAAFWTELVSPPLELVFFEEHLQLVSEPLLISAQLRMTASARREYSRNWSGVYITPRAGRQVTEVHARWDVPLVSAPASMSGSAEYRSSTWIGIDGQRRYFHSSLPQLGTAQFVNPSAGAPFRTWWQWWLRDNAGTYTPGDLNVDVFPGQRVMATLRVLNETQVHFFIKNRDTGASASFTVDAPHDTTSSVQAKVSGATAEWVVERPTSEVTAELYNLPDYDRIDFTDCIAVTAKMPPGMSPGPGIEQPLDGARVITMKSVARNPHRTVTISKAERSGPDGVTATYVRD